MGLAYRALKEGDSAPATLNAANEVAVQAFLDGNIGFSTIPKVIGTVMDQLPVVELASLADVLAADAAARQAATQVIGQHYLK